MKPSEIIDKALTEHLPDAEHWTQRSYGDGEKVCIMGAIGMTVVGCRVMVDRELSNEVRVVISDLKERVGTLLNRPSWGRWGSWTDVSPESAVVAYNDAPHRTYDEIRELMEKSRAGLQERGM